MNRLLHYWWLLVLIVAAGCSSGNKNKGTICSGANDCGSGVCAASKCAALCASQSSCQQGQLCVVNPDDSTESCVDRAKVQLSEEQADNLSGLQDAVTPLDLTGEDHVVPQDKTAETQLNADQLSFDVDQPELPQDLAPADLALLDIGGDLDPVDVLADLPLADNTPLDQLVNDTNQPDQSPPDGVTGDSLTDVGPGCTVPQVQPCATITLNGDWPGAGTTEPCSILEGNSLDVNGAKLWSDPSGACGCSSGTFAWDTGGIGFFTSGTLVVDLSNLTQCSRKTVVVVRNQGPINVVTNGDTQNPQEDTTWASSETSLAVCSEPVNRLVIDSAPGQPACYGLNLIRIDVY